MATHSCILAWRIPWTEEPDRSWLIGLQSQTRLKWLSIQARNLHIVFLNLLDSLAPFGKHENLTHLFTIITKEGIKYFLSLQSNDNFNHLSSSWKCFQIQSRIVSAHWPKASQVKWKVGLPPSTSSIPIFSFLFIEKYKTALQIFYIIANILFKLFQMCPSWNLPSKHNSKITEIAQASTLSWQDMI